jgi:hypothetical protein
MASFRERLVRYQRWSRARVFSLRDLLYLRDAAVVTVFVLLVLAFIWGVATQGPTKPKVIPLPFLSDPVPPPLPRSPK